MKKILSSVLVLLLFINFISLTNVKAEELKIKYINVVSEDNSNRTQMKAVTVEKNLLMSVEEIAKFIGADYFYDSGKNAYRVSYEMRNVEFEIGKQDVTVSGTKVQIPTPPVKVGNDVFFPPEYLIKFLNCNSYVMPDKQFVIAVRENPLYVASMLMRKDNEIYTFDLLRDSGLTEKEAESLLFKAYIFKGLMKLAPGDTDTKFFYNALQDMAKDPSNSAIFEDCRNIIDLLCSMQDIEEDEMVKHNGELLNTQSKIWDQIDDTVDKFKETVPGTETIKEKALKEALPDWLFPLAKNAKKFSTLCSFGGEFLDEFSKYSYTMNAEKTYIKSIETTLLKNKKENGVLDAWTIPIEEEISKMNIAVTNSTKAFGDKIMESSVKAGVTVTLDSIFDATLNPNIFLKIGWGIGKNAPLPILLGGDSLNITNERAEYYEKGFFTTQVIDYSKTAYDRGMKEAFKNLSTMESENLDELRDAAILYIKSSITARTLFAKSYEISKSKTEKQDVIEMLKSRNDESVKLLTRLLNARTEFYFNVNNIKDIDSNRIDISKVELSDKKAEPYYNGNRLINQGIQWDDKYIWYIGSQGVMDIRRYSKDNKTTESLPQTWNRLITRSMTPYYDYVYFTYVATEVSQNFGLFRVKKDGSKMEKLLDSYIQDFLIANDHIYYYSSGKLYECSLDGKNSTLISDSDGFWLNYDNGNLYFSNKNKYKVFNTKDHKFINSIDFIEYSPMSVAYNDAVYYLKKNFSDRKDDKLYKIELSSGKITEVLGNTKIESFNILNGYIYYNYLKKDTIVRDVLRKIKTDASGDMLIMEGEDSGMDPASYFGDDTIGHFVVIDGHMYYVMGSFMSSVSHTGVLIDTTTNNNTPLILK